MKDKRTSKCAECRRAYGRTYGQREGVKKKHAKVEKDKRRRNPIPYMLYNIKKRAEEKGLEFNLTAEDLQIPTVCPVLGIPIRIGRNSRGFSDNSPSVDRINPSRGYTKDNICIISWRANRIKYNSTYEELQKVLAYMERHRTKE